MSAASNTPSMRYQVWLYENDERSDLLIECQTADVFQMAAVLWGQLAPWKGIFSPRKWYIQVEEELRPPGEQVWARI